VEDLTIDTNSSETNTSIAGIVVVPGDPPITVIEYRWKEVPSAEQIDESTFEGTDFVVVFPGENFGNIDLDGIEGEMFNFSIGVQVSTRYLLVIRATNADETNERSYFIVFDTAGMCHAL